MDPAVHFHTATEHRHNIQARHDHETLIHAHIPDNRITEIVPHLNTGGHCHGDTTTMDRPCCLTRVQFAGAALAVLASTLQTTDDPEHGSSLTLAHLRHPRPAPYLTGPLLRGPPA